MNAIERVTVTISLVDKAGAPVQTWTLKNVWPTRITTDMKSEGNEVAIETLEMAYEGITVS